MSKTGIAVLVVAALVFTALGFVFGQVIQAANNSPGALVTESYVQKYVGEMMAEMQSQMDELEMRILSLSGGEADSTVVAEPLDNPGDSSTTTNTTNTPTPATPKTVKVKAGDGVNVRSEASTTASKVGSATAEAVLTYLGQKTDSAGQVWYNVRLDDGKEGWVAGWLCNEPQ
ncbi:MAG: SH3 domain-containing protein [Firmicutes bacterium]|nr:SH3 domain-containing protein [Bacillota bacterium]